MSLIDVRDIVKIYKTGDVELRALDGVTFSVDQGEFVSIMGHSGSGKSTMMNILGCLDVPTEGSYALNGREVGTLSGDDLARRNRQAFQRLSGLCERITRLVRALCRFALNERVEASHTRRRRVREWFLAEGARDADLVGNLVNRPPRKRRKIARGLIQQPPRFTSDRF